MKQYFKFLLICFFTLSSRQALAQTLASQSHLTLLLSAIASRYDDTALNPDNQIVQVPDQAFTAEIRPNLQLSYDKLDFILRPKLTHTQRQFQKAIIVDGERKKQDNETNFNWQELYANWRIGDPLILTWGIQNFQWGPAESINASNPIFRDAVLGRTILFEPESKHVVRLSRNFGQAFNLMAIIEADKETAAANQAQALLKAEYTHNSDSLGFVVFGQEGERGGFGEYGSVTFLESASVFFDISHKAGSSILVPSRTENPLDPQNPVIRLEPVNKDKERLYTLGVVGLRYEWENSDARIEYIGYENGYSKKQLDDLYQLLNILNASTPEHLTVFTAANQSGRLFPGKQHMLLSFRRSNLFNQQDTTGYFRYFFSMRDASAQVYGHLETAVGDQWWLFAAGGVGIGRKESEMRNYAKHTVIIGVKEMW